MVRREAGAPAGNEALVRTIQALERARSKVDGTPPLRESGGQPRGTRGGRGKSSRAMIIAAITVVAVLACATVLLMLSYREKVLGMRNDVEEMSSYVRLLEAKRVAEGEAYSRQIGLLKARIVEMEKPGEAPAGGKAEPVPTPRRRRFLGIF